MARIPRVPDFAFQIHSEEPCSSSCAAFLDVFDLEGASVVPILENNLLKYEEINSEFLFVAGLTRDHPTVLTSAFQSFDSGNLTFNN